MKVFKGIKNAFSKDKANTNNSIQWQGTFWNDGKKFPFAFEHMEIGLDGTITGHGTDTKGTYTLSGNVSLTGTVYILKKRNI